MAKKNTNKKLAKLLIVMSIFVILGVASGLIYLVLTYKGPLKKPKATETVATQKTPTSIIKSPIFKKDELEMIDLDVYHALMAERDTLLYNLKLRNTSALINFMSSTCAPFLYQTPTDASYDRFKDIKPYSNAVSTAYGVEYVNASFLSRFIVAQEPKEGYFKTFVEFLKKADIKLIVCLKEPPTYTKYMTKTKDVYNCNLFTVNKYEIDGHALTLIVCPIWPDQSTIEPDQVKRLYTYIQNNYKKEYDDKYKTLIHCTAGVGRTGTFIMYTLLTEHTPTSTPEDIMDMLIVMRSFRHQMIQNGRQLDFICDLFMPKGSYEVPTDDVSEVSES